MNREERKKDTQLTIAKAIVAVIVFALGVNLGGSMYDALTEKQSVKVELTDQERTLKAELRKQEAAKADQEKLAQEARFIQSLYELIPQHLSTTGLEPVSLLGMRPTADGGEIKVLVSGSDDESLYVFTYEANQVSFWVSEVQVLRASSPFTKFSSTSGRIVE